MTVQYMLGIDAGGSKTRARLIHLTSEQCFEAAAGPASLTNDFELALLHINQAIDQLLAQAKCSANQVVVVMGIAGAGNKTLRDRLKNSLIHAFASLDIYNDARTSLYGANLGKPVVAIALGTGSVGSCLDSNGKETVVGGWGFPAGDQGGGAQLGRMAIKALIDDIDQFGEAKSTISQEIYQLLGNSPQAVQAWLSKAPPSKFATLAPLVFAQAESCSSAKSMVMQHLADVETLIKQSQKTHKLPVVLLGGLAQPTLKYLKQFKDREFAPALGDSLDGACLLAKLNFQQSAKATASASSPEASIQSSITAQNKTLLIRELATMVSEERNPDTMTLDLMSSEQILMQMNKEDLKVAQAVNACLPEITKAVDLIVAAFQRGGRLVYLGAGTSGRLGILDAVECPPTFGVKPTQVVGIIAGGYRAIYQAVEGAEDNGQLAEDDLKAIEFNDKDILVGIAASGRTPYVIAGLNYAKAAGANTIALTCNPNSALTKLAQVVICPVVGAEVLTGSTRLKSGTAQKLVLNMLSTTSMIRIGKSFENLMVDLNASNEKLIARAIRIVIQATDCTPEAAENALKAAGFSVKLAIFHLLTNVSPDQGKTLLAHHQGFLRRAVENYKHE